MNERRIEINPGEMMLVADRTILVEEYESVLGDAFKIGSTDHELSYFITFSGRVNNSTESDSVTVAIPPVEAAVLVVDILHGLELLKAAIERGERS